MFRVEAFFERGNVLRNRSEHKLSETHDPMVPSVRREVWLLLSLAIVTLAGWKVLAATFALSWRNDEYTQILLILPVSATLIYLKWRSLRASFSMGLATGSFLLAMALLIACFALGWLGSVPTGSRLAVGMTALVLSWIGAFVICLGSRAARGVLFPLLFLFGAVPLPQSVLDPIVAWLQLGSGYSARPLFAICGVPVVQNGVFLTIPGLTIQIAPECSSIRSSSMLFVTTLVLAYLLLNSPWRRAIVIGLVIPLSVAKNGLRIFVLAMLGTRVNPGYLNGRLHHQGGIIYFLIALLCTFAVIWLLRKGDAIANSPKLEEIEATG